jgi:cytidine diphosphoramidate kinase
MVIWIIGISGAGKSTLAEAVEMKLSNDIKNLVILDGDVIREVFQNDLGYTIYDRRINANRMSRLSKFLDDQGIHVLCPILSIFNDSQVWNRKNIKNYYQVFIDTPLENVVQRDVKGIYSKFEKKEITGVVGMDIDFPRPVGNDLVIENTISKEDLLSYVDPIEKLISAK